VWTGLTTGRPYAVRAAALIRSVLASVNCGATSRTFHAGTSAHPAFDTKVALYTQQIYVGVGLGLKGVELEL